jgi:hypothetical protein
MERQMDTLGGAFSNLGDMVTRFAVAVGEAGLNQALQELTETMSEGVEGSTSLAQTLGEILGVAIRILTVGVRFLADNMEIVRAVLIAIGGRIIIGALIGLLGVITSLLTATISWGAAIAGALLIIPLIIEDFIFFVQGHDSLIGRMIGAWRDDDGFLGAVVRTFEDIVRFGGAAFEFLLGDVTRFVADAFAALQDLADFLTDIAEEFEEAQIRTELGGIEDQIADIDLRIQGRRNQLTAAGVDVRRGRTPEERAEIAARRQEAMRDLVEERERLVAQADDLERRANARFETSRRGMELREQAEQRARDQAEIARQAAATFERGEGGRGLFGINVGSITVENQVEGTLSPALGEEEMTDATAAGAAAGVEAAATLRDLES